jgi:hypothetical protein
MKRLTDAVTDLKELSLPREPYAAAKYLLIFAEDKIRKDNYEIHNKTNNEISPTFRRSLEDLIDAIQNVTIYL